ncbi:glycosyltransferase family 2 protein [Candidatus Villigracilis affinis]|uniref:glycosyltransferase family 2 protein n=1 Tax=Candidatus Villigracilis affinis TaxID=3140682 RepID=UPI001DFC669B|nr:glycosyltransferase family 2 protein [Anaerolineales bacterium]
MKPDISICITNYNAKDFLRDCLRSIYGTTDTLTFEIIVVDNFSGDGGPEMIRAEFPDVKLLTNEGNTGFTRPYNQAMRLAQGRHVVILNPDTVIFPNAFAELVGFLDSHPEVGIVSPKVLNRDGTLQKQCRRSEARPWDAICYFSGLSRLFPNDKRFAGYLMTYLPEDLTHEAEAVSGSCMVVRREVVEQIGYFDEDFFAYQEDTDYCRRTRLAGWKIFYVPTAQITHYGGEGGSKVQPYRTIIEWHRSYYLYFRKHFAKDYFFLFNFLYYLMMLTKLGYALLTNLFRRKKVVSTPKP